MHCKMMMDSVKSVLCLLVIIIQKTNSENSFKSVPVTVKTYENETVLLPCYVDDLDLCTTPEGSKGNCVEISKCPALRQLIKTTKIAPKDVALLKNSACGFDGTKPKVCCPYMCQTAEGEQGKCVDRGACTSLCQQCQMKKCFGSESVCCPLNEKVEIGNCQRKISAFPPNLNTHCCGRESTWDDRITGAGGVETSIDKYPWLSLIEYQQSGGIGTFCGGVLVSGKYVLTAAHCVAGDILNSATPVSVRLGEHDTSTKIDCRPVVAGGVDCNEEPVSLPIEATIPHPQYDAVTRRNDIALIRLKGLAPFNDFIRPICLPTNDVTVSSNYLKFYVAGWGKVNATLLQSPFKVHVDVPFVNQEICQKAYSVARRNATLWKGQLCAGGEVGKDACRGDSGGPLMFEGREQMHVVGVVSFGTKNCGSLDVPGIYTKVFEYVDWIYSNIVP